MISRRSFLKVLGIGGAGVALGAKLPMPTVPAVEAPIEFSKFQSRFPISQELVDDACLNWVPGIWTQQLWYKVRIDNPHTFPMVDGEDDE